MKQSSMTLLVWGSLLVLMAVLGCSGGGGNGPDPEPNRAPVVARPMADVRVAQDAPRWEMDLAPVFTDPEGAALTFTVASNTNPRVVMATVTGTRLALDFQRDQSGTAALVVRATDPAGATAEDSLTITVNARPVVARPMADVRVDEDAPRWEMDLAPVFTDPEGAALTFTVASNTNPRVVMATVTGTRLALDFQRDQSGTAALVVRATDPAGATAEDSLTITVISMPDPPVVTRPPDQNNIIGEEIAPLQLMATHVDNPGGACTGCTFSASGLPPDLALDPATGRITGSIAFTAFTRGEGEGPLYTVTAQATAPPNRPSAPVSFPWRVTQGEIGTSGEGGESVEGGGSEADSATEGEAGDGADTDTPLHGAICRFVDLTGRVRAMDVADCRSARTPGRYFLAGPRNTDGFIECHPGSEDINRNGRLDPGEDCNGNGRLDLERPELVLSTFVTTRGLRPREVLKKWNVSPRTEVLRHVIDGVRFADPASNLVAIQRRFLRDLTGLRISETVNATNQITSFQVSAPPTDPAGNDTAILAFAATELFLAALIEGQPGRVVPGTTYSATLDSFLTSSTPLPRNSSP